MFENRRIDGIQRSGAHGLKDFGGIVVHAGGDDDDGAGTLRHDPAGGFNAVHFRHDQIHQDQVGGVRGAASHRLLPVKGDPSQFMAATAGQDAPHGFHRHNHVIYNRDPHASGSPIKSTTA